MAVPSPADADAATVRVRLVADMLLQKAQEVQSKGNAGAAQSLADSAAELQRAATLLTELARLVHLPPPRLRSDSDASLSSVASNDGSTISSLSAPARAPPPASASVKDLVTKLSRVDAMLGKKSDEMKHKGNDNAAHALLQSAHAVRLAAQHIAEQQLLTRTLVVSARALREQLREHCRLVLADDDEISDETPLDEELTKRALDNVRALAAMRDVLREVAPTAASSADELRELLQLRGPASETHGSHNHEIERLSSESTSLRRLLEETQVRHERELRDADADTENMRRQCAALEKALEELEAEYHERRERELEHLNALHERQKGTHEELKKLLLAKEEEVTALKLQADAWMNQFAQQQDTIAELREQLEEDHHFYDRQVGELREQLHARDAELHMAREEVHALSEQLEDRTSSVPGDEERSDSTALADNYNAVIQELRQQLEVVQSHRDSLLAEREDTLVAMEEAQLRVDTIRNDLNARLEEADRAASIQIQARDARVAELEAALTSAADQTKQKETTDGGERVQALEEQLEHLRRDLDKEHSRYSELEQLYEQAEASLKRTKEELQRHVEALASLREEAERRAEQESTRSAHALAHEKRVSELEDELAQQRTRTDALETDVQDKIGLLAALKAQIQAAELASSTTQAEMLATSQQLQQLQSELTAVREENAGWQRDLLVVATGLQAENESLTETVPVNQVVKALGVRCTRLLDELKEFKSRCHELALSHEAVRAKQLEELAELRNTISQLEEEKSTAEKQYETLKATHLAAAEVNGVHESASEELTKKLGDLEAEFERYRTRSHAALKKIEKRAELLNSMRKENETLTKQVEELNLALSAATGKEQSAVARLEEVNQTLRMREEEMAQQIQEATAKLDEAERRCADSEAASRNAQHVCDEATAKMAKLQEEKEELARTKQDLHEQALELKDIEVSESKVRLEEAREARAQLEEQVSVLEATITQREEQIATLENEIRSLRNAADQVASRMQDLEDEQEAKSSRINALAASLEEKQRELSDLIASKDTDKVVAEAAEDERKRVTADQESAKAEAWNALETELRGQLRKATHEMEELTARLMEIQLAKVAVEQEAEQLRSEVASLKNELETHTPAASVSVDVSPSADANEMAALKESQHAKEAQILRLLDEIEVISKRQLEDQRTITELNSQLRQSEQRLVEAQEQLRGDTIKALRERVRQLEAAQVERSVDLRDETDDETAPRKESDDLASLQATRQSKREQYELEMESANRKKAMTDYLSKASDVIRELQQSMDEYSSVFRDACELRDEEAAADGGLNGHATVNGGAAGPDLRPDSDTSTSSNSTPEYEEYLMLKSGVVVKAGSAFSLPVYCDKPGCRVEWKFAVTEDGADVGFALLVETTASDGTRSRETIVAPARVNELSGVYDAPDGAALRFEWDNTFSWLNEKTLDYHVSVLEPLSASKMTLRVQERELQAKVAKVAQGLALLQVEKQRREQLESTLQRFEQCAEEKDTQLARFAQRRATIQQSKTALHARMEELKTQLSAFVTELDDMATGEREVTKAWDALRSEHDDVDMTMRLSANSRLDELMDTLQSRKKLLENELANVTNALASSG